MDTISEPAPQPTEDRSWSRLRRELTRSDTDRVISGLAGGIAARLGIPSAYVRAGFIVATLAGGAGIAVYLFGWALTLDNDAEPLEPASPAPTRQRIALIALYLGFLLLMQSAGIWFGNDVVWPVGIIVFGAALIWDRTDDERRQRLTQFTRGTETGRGRIIGGIALFAIGLATLFSSVESFDLGPVLVAAAMAAAGFMLLFGPWVMRMANDLAEERRVRIRSEEKAEMAAHLHDSVLQTLALIQRSDDPKRMVTLARSQERELREWLYGSGTRELGRIRGAVEAAADRVEHDHNIPIEVVVVGDAALDPDSDALVKAASEAMSNAARHSGAEKVSVFVEVTDAAVEAFINDQGKGFDPGTIDPARRGVVESLRGRMERHGGTVEITSVPGEGTEVALHVNRRLL
jgi:signal transduction histidine kinase/phage shock protein PspC (stress-responsive transcriptional regulator)